jgi:hypothetical protein
MNAHSKHYFDAFLGALILILMGIAGALLQVVAEPLFTLIGRHPYWSGNTLIAVLTYAWAVYYDAKNDKKPVPETGIDLACSIGWRSGIGAVAMLVYCLSIFWFTK